MLSELLKKNAECYDSIRDLRFHSAAVHVLCYIPTLLSMIHTYKALRSAGGIRRPLRLLLRKEK